MKASIMIAFLLTPAFFAMTAPAQAKFAPVEAQSIAISLDDTVIAGGTSGAMREQSYFSAPQSPLGPGNVFPCRMQLNLFEKTRLARSCN
jgi:hypothetical protein